MSVNFESSPTKYISHERFSNDQAGQSLCDTGKERVLYKPPENSFHKYFYPIIIGILAIISVTAIVIAGVAIAHFKPSHDHVQATEDAKGGIQEIVNKTAMNMVLPLMQTFLNQSNTINGWVTSGNFIFKIFPERVIYRIAERRCQDIGGKLAAEILRHPDAVRYIYDGYYVVDEIPVSQPWIGFNDLRQEGVWEWVDGGKTNPDTAQWRRGEPNNGGGNEDCGNILASDNGKAHLNDAPCNGRYNYICEVEER